MSGVALYRKWRPLAFSDVWGQAHITRALSSQVESGRVSHAYLFTGTRGTGKTTCAKILARAVNCERPRSGDPCNECESCRASLAESALDISEIDAASNNGVDNIREMREEAFLAPTALKYRVYIIDEVHMLSVGAFNALLKILEEPPAHVIFILATTELHKVPATVISRCQRYDFRRIAPEIIAENLMRIAQSEGAELMPDAAAMLAKLGDGSARDAISLLDRCMEGGKIETAQIAEALGFAPREAVTKLLDAVIDADAARALSVFAECYMDGRDIVSLMDELLSLLRDIYIAKATREPNALAEKCGAARLDHLTGCLCELLRRFTRTAIRRVDAEMCILRMTLPGSSQPVQFAEPVAAQHAKQAAPAQAEADVPWETPENQPETKPEPKKSETAAAAKAAGSELEALVRAASPNVNSAVRTYLSLAECENIDNTLHIFVAEESIGFMQKPAAKDAISAAALSLGYTGVNISGPRKAESPALSAQDLLSRAKSLGVNVKTG